MGITGPSHAVIANIGKVAERAAAGAWPRLASARRPTPAIATCTPTATRMEYGQIERGLAAGDLAVAAGTAWYSGGSSPARLTRCWTRRARCRWPRAGPGAARNLVLVGDPQQLAQAQPGRPSAGAGASPWSTCWASMPLCPPRPGCSSNWRMHPRLCRYTSLAFYDGRLTGVAGLERRDAWARGRRGAPGLGCTQCPTREHHSSLGGASRTLSLVRELTGRGADSRRHPLGPNQVAGRHALQRAGAGRDEEALGRGGPPAGVRVGTVDKFQGREAAVTMYSMATSSTSQAPRGLEFLFDTRQVATSRARAWPPGPGRCVLPNARQMELVNALCRAWETGQ